jgi:HPt (histidine-containing phosphotransfer) domain-containing protein
VIDWTRIKDLHDEIGPDAFVDVIDLFVQEVSDGVDSLNSAESPAARMQAFHFLKGAALNLGLTDLAQACALGEQRAAQGGDTQDLVTDVSRAFPHQTGILAQTWRAQVAAV